MAITIKRLYNHIRRWTQQTEAADAPAAGSAPTSQGNLSVPDRVDDPAYSNSTLLVFAHQDDELLWMQPFLDTAAALLLAGSPPAPTHQQIIAHMPGDYLARWHSSFPAVGTDQEWLTEFAFRDRCDRDREWSFEKLAKPISEWIARPEVKQIITHNNWGEYGHIHHRWVNQAVRKAAVLQGKDVWVLNSMVLIHGTGAVYLDLGDWGLPSVRKLFDHEAFTQGRCIYQQRTFCGEPREVSAWTWFDGPSQYPQGIRTFVKIVDAGHDCSQDDPEIRHRVEAISAFLPVREACPETVAAAYP